MYDSAEPAGSRPSGRSQHGPKITEVHDAAFAAHVDHGKGYQAQQRQCAFCGAIGFASPTAGLELSVAIRTFESSATTTWLDAGGGITTGSDPAAEAAECLAKATPLLAAIGATLAGTPAGEATTAGDDAAHRVAVPRPLRLGAHPVPRPDPARGVFETILVVDGVAVAAEAHLERLGRAARELYGFALPEAVEALVRYTALEQGRSCRLRVVLDPRGDVGVEVAELPEPGDVVLEPVVLAGGLGDRKWRDRRWIDAAERATAPAIPLLVDADGQILETTRANVFAVLADDTVVTPPLDGRILPGVTRAAVAEAIDAQERPLTLTDLDTAAAVLVCNALRGLEPVARIGDRALSAPSDRVRTSLSRFPPLR